MGILSNLFGKKKLVSLNEPGASLQDVEHFRRPCWFPVIQDGDDAVTATKFAGIPFLAPGEKWPVCPNCGHPIQLFLQLNSDDLPDECGKLWGEGLLQFFYCTNREPMCDADVGGWEPFSRISLLRVVPAVDNVSDYSASPVIDAFPPKLIIGWTQSDDLPMYWTELYDYGVTLSETDAEEMAETYPREGEKLLGWPYWVQDKEYPNCPECGTEMTLVFQIDSYKSLPYMFGDAGIGHITQCPKHKSVLAFGWACS